MFPTSDSLYGGVGLTLPRPSRPAWVGQGCESLGLSQGRPLHRKKEGLWSTPFPARGARRCRVRGHVTLLLVKREMGVGRPGTVSFPVTCDRKWRLLQRSGDGDLSGYQD